MFFSRIFFWGGGGDGGRSKGDETVTADLVLRCFSVACEQRINKKGCAQRVDVERQLPKP